MNEIITYIINYLSDYAGGIITGIMIAIGLIDIIINKRISSKTVTKEAIREIKSDQLFKVFLPLKRSLEPYIRIKENLITKDHAHKVCHCVYGRLMKYYEYFPDNFIIELQILEDTIKSENDKAYQRQTKVILSIIRKECEYLKKELGYPTKYKDKFAKLEDRILLIALVGLLLLGIASIFININADYFWNLAAILVINSMSCFFVIICIALRSLKNLIVNFYKKLLSLKGNKKNI